MKFEIKNILSWRLAVEAAIKSGAEFNNEEIKSHIIIGPIGLRGSQLVLIKTDKKTYALTGCHQSTVDEFLAQVKNVHGSNKHAKNYQAAVKFGLEVMK